MGTLKRSKIFLINSAFIFGALTIGACASSLGIKIYLVDSSKGGLYREQADELVKFKDADGYFCTNKDGMRKLAQAYKLCKDLIDEE